ncbi:MAG: trypsin-like peptidase domain-containing protein [Planctomycetes bacterium]|nr:trypsin-like peptidase domain-containing protein [Planctomycetota bacterium]
MHRFLLWAGLAGCACLALVPARGDQKPSLGDALALQETMERAIREAEPSIACILVSRSPVYQKWFGETPHPETPGRLGDFNPDRAALQAPPNERAQVDELKKEIALKLKQYSNSTAVELEIKKQFDLSNPAYVPESYGSGVVVEKSGLILTNYHVVRDAKKVYVRLPGGQGSYANIRAADPRSDLAILELLDTSLQPLPAIRLGDGGHVRKGQFVLTIANPFAAGFRDGSPSASWGILSNLRRRAPAKPGLDEMEHARLSLHHFGTLLQTDARLNLGCSGGALIDLRGELIGLTTTLAAVTGGETAGGFAVPLDDDFKRIVAVLEQGKEVDYGFLGVGFERDIVRGDSVRLGRVLLNSAASRAGLLPGDAILEVNDFPVRENDDLFLAVGKLLAGSEARLKVRSLNGRVRMVTVKLDKFYQPTDQIIASNQPAWVRGLRVDYTSVLVQRDPFLREIPRGVYVREVQPNSPADEARLQEAVITEVNGQPVHDPDEFYREADKVEKTAALVLTVVNREGSGSRQVKLVTR